MPMLYGYYLWYLSWVQHCVLLLYLLVEYWRDREKVPLEKL